LFRFIKDDDLQVRKQVAERLPEVSLGLMAVDPAPDVRRIVAERMSAEDAEVLLQDSDWVVRYTVALKVAPDKLINLLEDPEPDVSAVARQRFQATHCSESDHD
jgi:hypothetical protein